MSRGLSFGHIDFSLLLKCLPRSHIGTVHILTGFLVQRYHIHITVKPCLKQHGRLTSRNGRYLKHTIRSIICPCITKTIWYPYYTIHRPVVESILNTSFVHINAIYKLLRITQVSHQFSAHLTAILIARRIFDRFILIIVLWICVSHIDEHNHDSTQDSHIHDHLPNIFSQNLEKRFKHLHICSSLP